MPIRASRLAYPDVSMKRGGRIRGHERPPPDGRQPRLVLLALMAGETRLSQVSGA